MTRSSLSKQPENRDGIYQWSCALNRTNSWKWDEGPTGGPMLEPCDLHFSDFHGTRYDQIPGIRGFSQLEETPPWELWRHFLSNTQVIASTWLSWPQVNAKGKEARLLSLVISGWLILETSCSVLLINGATWKQEPSYNVIKRSWDWKQFSQPQQWCCSNTRTIEHKGTEQGRKGDEAFEKLQGNERKARSWKWQCQWRGQFLVGGTSIFSEERIQHRGMLGYSSVLILLKKVT